MRRALRSARGESRWNVPIGSRQCYVDCCWPLVERTSMVSVAMNENKSRVILCSYSTAVGVEELDPALESQGGH